MKTLLFSNQGLSPSHLGIELEIILQEIQSGNEIEVLYCRSNLDSCFFNSSHNILACSICEGRSSHFHSEIGLSPKQRKPLQKKVSSFSLPPITTMDDVENIRYKNLEIGRGIASSYISTRRNYEFNTEDVAFIQEMAIMCANVVENMESRISEFHPDQVILFNGRFAENNAVIEVCQKHGIAYYTFERSSAEGKYRLLKNALPHSISYAHQEIQGLWEKANPETRAEIGRQWFENRLKGGEELLQKFLAKQKKGTLPEGFDPKKQNIGIFVNSEDEFKLIKEYQFDGYRNQNEAIHKILSHFENNQDLFFYLRVHPHLRNIDSAQVREINEMNYSNVLIIHADEEIDTYELVRNCNRIVTFGSTVGIESTFLGKPSILFGNSFYRGINSVYTPQTYQELYDLIANKDLEPKPQENTLPYGFYQNTVGYPFTRFEEGGKKNSLFDSKPINRVYVETILIGLRNVSQFPQWLKMNKLILKEPLNRKTAFKLNSHLLKEKLD